MHTLAKLNLQFRTTMDLDGTQSPFDLLRRHVIRLGRRFQAANALLAYGTRIPELRGTIDVCPVETPPESQLPPPDTLTDFDSIIGRMLPDKSRLATYRHALADIDEKHDLFRCFLHNYESGNVKQYVHAEVQVLDLFHARGYMFAADDNFIASSRPACLSCLAYFRSHPGRFVEPVSDRKICLSWRPAAIEGGQDSISKKVQEITMNEFNKFIRKEALYQILKKSSIPSGRPGFPNMAPDARKLVRTQKPTAHLQELFAQLETLVGPQNQPDEGNRESESSDAARGPRSLDSAREVTLDGNQVHHSWQVESPSWSCSDADEMLDDSDSDGGVALPNSLIF